MYFLGGEKDLVCHRRTNQLDWADPKKARKFVDYASFLPSRMLNVYKQIVSERKEDVKAFNTINFCEKVLSAHTDEEVAAYNSGLHRLYRWLKLAIETRKAYIIRTKAHAKRDREERLKRIEQAEEREKTRETYLAEAHERFLEDHREELAAYEEYQAQLAKREAQEYGDEAPQQSEEEEKEPPVKPEYNEHETIARFDEEHPEVEIPPEVVEPIHNDWVLTEEEEHRLIDEYWGIKEQ